MFLTSTLSSLQSEITSSKSQNKITKFPHCLTLLLTTISILLKLTINLVIYVTRSWGGSIIGLIIPLSTPSSCDLQGESLTLSTETFWISIAFSLASKLVWTSNRGWLPNASSRPIPTSFTVFHESISISSPTSWDSFTYVTEVDLVGNAMVVVWKSGITRCGINFW